MKCSKAALRSANGSRLQTLIRQAAARVCVAFASQTRKTRFGALSAELRKTCRRSFPGIRREIKDPGLGLHDIASYLRSAMSPHPFRLEHHLRQPSTEQRCFVEDGEYAGTRLVSSTSNTHSGAPTTRLLGWARQTRGPVRACAARRPRSRRDSVATSADHPSRRVQQHSFCSESTGAREPRWWSARRGTWRGRTWS